MFLSHITALEFMGLDALTQLFCDGRPQTKAFSKTGLDMMPAAVGRAPTPDILHVTVTERSAEHHRLQKRDGIVCHYIKPPLPRNALRYLGARERNVTSMASTSDGLLQIPCEHIASPELTFLQLACGLSVLERVFFGLEMCSSTHSLTTAERIKGLLARMSGRNGAKAARQAAGLIADGSASPMESLAYMALCLPRAYGGYGLPRAVFNHVIPLTGKAGSVSDKNYFRCDLFWPIAKVAVEYDSTAHHSRQDQITSDAVRRDILGNMGITVMTLTWPQLRDQVAMKRFAALLAQHLGFRMRPDRLPDKRRQAELGALIARVSSGSVADGMESGGAGGGAGGGAESATMML